MGLTAASTPQQIAAAYDQYAGMAGGDTQAAQESAVDFLTNLGISEPNIEQAYTTYTAPKFTQPFQEEQVDPYVYAYEYGVANNDFSGLLGLLKQTPDSTALVSKYSLTPEQINQIEFGTGFDLDQSGGYGAGKVGNDWDYNGYLDLLRAGDADSLGEAARMFATLDPLAANNVQNMFDELLKQQTVTGDNWSAGNLGSKEAAAMDFALRLAENNVGSIYDLGQRTIERIEETEGGPQVIQEVEYYNKKTGEALPDWDRVASAPNSGSRLTYNLNFAEDGTPIPYTTRNQSDWIRFREGFLKPAVSLVALANPALAPYIAAGNAINAADKGDWGSAIVSGLTAAVGFGGSLGFTESTIATLNQAKTGAQVLNALDKGNPIAVANALMQTDTGKGLLTMDMGSGVTLGNVLDTAKIAASVNAGDYASALNYAGSLTGSPDLRVAGSSVAFLNAVQSGDPFKIATAMGQLDKAVKTATKDSGSIANRLSDAGLQEADLPTGIQTASADGETPFRVEAAGAPIFADSPQASSVRPPSGYRLMATSEEQEVQDGERTRYVKPAGSYYDYTANAWFTPSGEFDSATNVTDYSTLFGGDQANLTDADLAAIRGGGLGSGSNASDFGVDWDSIYQPSGAPRSGGSDMGEMVITAPRDAPTDLGEMVITAPREPVTDMGEMVITAPRDTTTDLGEMVITAPREEFEYPEMVVTAPRDPAIPETPATPAVPSAPTPPTTPAVPATPTTPAQVAQVKKQLALTLNLPASSPIVQDIFEALYGTMEYLDISEEFKPSERKAKPADTQKQLQQTKMAQGGYLDDLLAENMSVDDLLNLLR